LADVINTILDKGLVIDVYARISALGVEFLTIDARIVIASVDTYLRFAEAVARLDLTQTEVAGIPGMMQETPKRITKGKVTGVIDAIKEEFTGH
jgi:hypothetical protein